MKTSYAALFINALCGLGLLYFFRVSANVYRGLSREELEELRFARNKLLQEADSYDGDVKKAYRTLALKYYQQIDSDKIDFYMTMLNLAKEAVVKGFSEPDDLDEYEEDEDIDESRMLPGTHRLSEDFTKSLMEWQKQAIENQIEYGHQMSGEFRHMYKENWQEWKATELDEMLPAAFQDHHQESFQTVNHVLWSLSRELIECGVKTIDRTKPSSPQEWEMLRRDFVSGVQFLASVRTDNVSYTCSGAGSSLRCPKCGRRVLK